MSIKSFLSKKTDTLGYGLACIAISAIVSLGVSFFTINRSTSKELKAALFKDEIPVLNRVSEIWSECALTDLVIIGEHHIIEMQPIVYIDSNGDEVGRDSLVKETLSRDTVSVYIPAFAYKKESYEVLRESIEFLHGNLDKLSPETYTSIVDLLSYLEKYPVTWMENESDRLNNIWTKPEVYSGFFDRLGTIYSSYIRRQKKYL